MTRSPSASTSALARLVCRSRQTEIRWRARGSGRRSCSSPAARPSAEALDHPAQARGQRVDLAFGVVERRAMPAWWRRWPSRSITGIAQWWPVRTAMPSRSSSVPTSCGMQLVDARTRCTLHLCARRADDAQARDLLQRAGGIGQQLGARARRCRSRPSELDVIDRGAEPDRRLDRRRAGLELVRQLVELGAARS